MSEETEGKTNVSDSLDSLVSLDWNDWNEGKGVKRKELLLVEVKKANGENDYHTGRFSDTTQGGLFGVIGGHFHFDHKITRWASIKHLIPN